ncbi:MAG: RDD family protein [Marinifilaceae bacterium]
MTTQNIITQEATIAHQKANLGNRFLAFLIDGFVMLGLMIPAFLVFMIASGLRYRLGLVSIFLYFIAVLLYLLPLLYSLLKDGMKNGQSIGKRILNIKVISLRDNSSCNYGKSAGRNAMMTLLNLIPLVGWIIEPILVLSENHGRRLGDKVADTMVVDSISVDSPEEKNREPRPFVSDRFSRDILPIIAVLLIVSLLFDMSFPYWGYRFLAAPILGKILFLFKICIPFACAIGIKNKIFKIVLFVLSSILFLMWLLDFIMMF